MTMASRSIQDLFGVKGYVAVVTGGSSGLGFMICKVYLSPFRIIADVAILTHDRASYEMVQKYTSSHCRPSPSTNVWQN